MIEKKASQPGHILEHAFSFLLNEVLEHMCPGEGKMSVRELELVDRFHKRKTSAINPAHL